MRSQDSHLPALSCCQHSLGPATGQGQEVGGGVGQPGGSERRWETKQREGPELAETEQKTLEETVKGAQGHIRGNYRGES